jgi:hypothetical protein
VAQERWCSLCGGQFIARIEVCPDCGLSLTDTRPADVTRAPGCGALIAINATVFFASTAVSTWGYMRGVGFGQDVRDSASFGDHLFFGNVLGTFFVGAIGIPVSFSWIAVSRLRRRLRGLPPAPWV